MNALKGVGVALVTPFQQNGKVDYTGLEKLVNHVSKGVHFLVVMGTTGEAVTLKEDEQLAILDYIIEVNAGKLPIVFGMGGSDTASLAKRMESFDRKGVAAFLTASPAYNKPTQEGIFHHYVSIAERSALPILLYNVPGRTASNVKPETVLRIAEHTEKVIGIKEAAGSIEQVMTLSSLMPELFLILSGDDPLLVPHMACGGHGIISVVANAYPEEFRKVYENCLNGEYRQAREVHYRLRPLIDALFAEGNPGGVKEVLQYLGICQNHMRLPLFPVSKDHSQSLYRLIAEMS